MGYTRTRRKSNLVGSWTGRDGSLVYGPYEFVEAQATTDSTHNWPPSQGAHWDEGGPFSSTRYYIDPMPHFLNEKYRFGTYNGPVFARFAGTDASLGNAPAFTDIARSSDFVLNGKGTTAVSRCKPTNSVADASVAIGETLRDGLPSMIGSGFLKKEARRRTLGGEYLNYQFGWAPLASDLRKFALAVKTKNQVIEQLVRDSGKRVRRRYAFDTESTTTNETIAQAYPNPVLNSYMYSGGTSGSLKKTTTITSRVWFSGAFTYHVAIPSSRLESLRTYSQMADKLLGLSLTPETVWNLAPWSWAADWFFNIGDIMSNISDAIQFGLVMQYGYIMEEKISTTLYSHRGATTCNGTSLDCDQVFTKKVMTRRPASPFGFGLTWDGFSPSQLAVIAALGLTRGGSHAAM